MHTNEEEARTAGARRSLRAVEVTLRRQLEEALARSAVQVEGGLRVHSASSTAYQGIWPDDFVYPLIVDPALLGEEARLDVIAYLTASCVDLDRVPDRVEGRGLAVMQPGALGAPHAQSMPLHLPAAWVRLLDYFEQWGTPIPQKEDWARLIERSFDQAPFSRGLAYVDPQWPRVGFGFHDPCAITGWELMSSVVLHRGLQRAARLFDGYAAPAVIQRWRRLAEGIRSNLGLLYDEQAGAYWAGSVDCKQIDVWGNGLAYWLSDDARRRRIVAWYKANRARIFLRGCARQVAEDAGWQRQLTPVPLGHYTNGGFWATGTGFVLAAIADQDLAFAAELAGELAQAVESLESAEWIDAAGAPHGARWFTAALSVPLLALKSIFAAKSFLDYL